MGGENEREWGVILFSLASPAAHSLFITNEEHAAHFAGGIIIEIPCFFFTESNQEEIIFIRSLLLLLEKNINKCPLPEILQIYLCSH